MIAAMQQGSTAGENKQLMQFVFAEMSKGNSKPFYESLADDVRWTITGSTKWSKTYEGKQCVVNDLLGPLRALFADQYKATATRFTAEEDRVVVEGRGSVMTKSGREYNNHYCWIYTIANGKVKEITEYLDTELVNTVLG